MRVVVEGHKYELENFEDKNKFQILQFIHKEPSKDFSKGFVRIGELETISDGTTNEELLEVLINRMKFLNGKFPCRENSIVITKLEEAQMWLEKRTKDRVNRGVEGKNEK